MSYMKKLLMILTMIFFSFTLMGQKMTNYEKYKLEQEQTVTAPDTVKMTKKEWDDLYYTKADAKAERLAKRKSHVDPVQSLIDTLKQDNPNIQVNVYELDPFYYSNRIGMMYHGGFNYWRYSNLWYYSNNFWIYDNYGYNWYGGNNFYFGYTTFGNFWRPFPDYQFNWWYNGWYNGYNNNHYGMGMVTGMNAHNQWRGGMGNGMMSQNTPQYGRRERPSSMIQPQDRRPQIDRPINSRGTSPQNMKPYSESRRSQAYTPSYEKPRMTTKPAFNNSRPNSGMMEQRRANMGNGNENMQRGNMGGNMNRGNIRTTPTENRTYTAPSRSYVQPQQQSQGRREFTAPTQSRSDFNYSPSRSYSAPSQSSGSYSGSSQSSSGSSSSGSTRPRR